MTSANVSNIPVQPVASTAKSAQNVSDGNQEDFLTVMNKSTGSDPQNVSNKSTYTMGTAVGKKDVTNDSYQMDKNKTEIKTKNPVERPDQETLDQASDAVKGFSEDVKDVLKEQLGVSDEDIKDAMETLGLSFVDLTDPANMTQLITQLTGCENTVELLMNDSFSNILDSVAQLTTEMLDKTQMTLQEINFAMKEMDPQLSMVGENMAEVMPEELAQQATIEVTQEVTSQESLDPQLTEGDEQGTSSTQQTAEEGQIIVEVTNDSKKIENPNTTEASQNNTDTFEEGVNQTTASADTSDASDGHENHKAMSEKTPNMPDNNDQISLNAATADVKAFDAIANQTTQQTSYVTDARALMEQVVQAAKVSISQGETTMEMMLNPESLGKLYMQISEKEGNVSAHIYTQNEAAKEALETQMIQLRDNLNQQGVKVDSVEVSVGTHEFEKNLEDNAQREKQQGEDMEKSASKRSRNIDLNNLDELQGLMTEEEELVAKIMRDNGNTVNYTA